MFSEKVALITGSARRVGAAIAEYLHGNLGMKVIIHYRRSAEEAQALVARLNAIRVDSAVALCADLSNEQSWKPLIEQANAVWGRLDVLVNNASDFFESSCEFTTPEQWDILMTANVKAPYFLSQYAVPYLRTYKGNIIHITDIHAEKPLAHYGAYCISKAGLRLMTLAQAKEWGPDIRVNAVAPGAVEWPEGNEVIPNAVKQKIIEKTALKRRGTPHDIALAVGCLLVQPFITGQCLHVDGGRI